MTYQTEEKLKSYLDSNQLSREQLCRAILATDKRYADVRPRHPRGGRDGGRDIEAIFRETQIVYGAVGFLNQANDSKEHKKKISKKFLSDLARALATTKRPDGFVFFTNLNLTIGEKDSLVEEAKKQQLKHCEIFDRERMRIVLDSPEGFFIRFQHLNIPLSEAEQASFFARWGDDIQSVITTGLQRVERTLDRVLFYQEARDPIHHFTLSFELKEEYPAEDIGHFRLFCLIYLKEIKHDIFGILFGSSDKSNRMRNDISEDSKEQPPGIQFGISGGEWEMHMSQVENKVSTDENDDERYTQVGCFSSIGRKVVPFLPISYTKDTFMRLKPCVSLLDFDDAMFLPILNKSLTEKISAIHVYCDGYKIQEIGPDDFCVDCSDFGINIPVSFTPEELSDPWVRIRPSGMFSAFHIRFYEKTPLRMFIPEQIVDSLKSKKR